MAISKTDSIKSPRSSHSSPKWFMPFRVERNGDLRRFKIYWRRLLVWVLASFVFVWVSVATGIYCFIKYNSEYRAVRYRHILFIPFQLKEYRRAKGEFFLELGKEQFAQKLYLDAFTNMRMGLHQIPQDLQARKFVTELYFAINRPDLATPMVVDGLPYHVQNVDYLQWMFTLLLRAQQDDTVVKTSTDILSTYTLPANQRHCAIMAQATAHYLRARYNEAKKSLSQHSTDTTRDGRLLMAKLTWEQGDHATATGLFAQVMALHPDDEEAYVDYVSALRRSNRHDEVRRVALMRRLRFPESPLPHIDILRSLHAVGNLTELAKGEDEYIIHFNGVPAALNRLSLFAAQSGRPEVCLRLYKLAQQAKSPVTTSATGLIEAYVEAREYDNALAAIDSLSSENVEWAKQESTSLVALRIIATYATGSTIEARNMLVASLNQPNQRADLIAILGQRLVKVGGVDLARLAFVKALEIDPYNQISLQNILELDLKEYTPDDLPRNVARLLALRKPSAKLIRNMREQLESDKYLFLADRQILATTLDQALR
ncbi:MAG: hypothetical protein H7067_07265 [Burkholderiales bacterium]|nr:hypothetical protein [Opitutaceae bacterium]